MSDVRSKMKRINRHIALILTLLLLAGGATNVAQAAKVKVTYHILTLPFTTQNYDLGDEEYSNRCVNIRVEAIRYVQEVESGTTINLKLPDHFKSPLAKNFRYYSSAKIHKLTNADAKRSNYIKDDGYFIAGKNNRVQIYQYMTTTFDTYYIDGTTDNADYDLESTDLEAENKEVTVSSNVDYYVTYEYNPSNGIAVLDGVQEYNIQLGDRFLALNKGRNNRPAAILANNLSSDNLISEEFSYVATPGFSWQGKTTYYYHFRFVLEGGDPYNIVLRTAYKGDDVIIDADKALGNKNVKKYIKGSSLFCQGKDNGGNNLWLASDDDKQYTQTSTSDPAAEVTYVIKPGFYRGGTGGGAEMDPIWNSFAMLNADEGEGYVFMGTKINSNGKSWQPTSSGQYFYLTGSNDSGANPRFNLKTPAQAAQTSSVEKPYEIREYTYKVKTPFYKESDSDEEKAKHVLTAVYMESQYNGEVLLHDHIPDALKRKYITFTGTYKSDTFTDENAITTFDDVETAGNGRVIWLSYTYEDMPFETLPADGNYQNARWYTMRMNGQAAIASQYLVKYNDTNFITSGGHSNLHTEENSAEAQVAFMGDPFELKILSRKASENASPSAANRYIGCATASPDATLFTAVTGTSDISSWEIEDDTETDGTIVLREIGTYASPKYLGWKSDAEGKPIYYKTESSRIRFVDLEKKTYVFHIVRDTDEDGDGDEIAVKASASLDVGQALNGYANIPSVIRSPFLALPGVTVKFYWNETEAKNATAGSPGDFKACAPYNVTIDSNKDVYVRYFGMSTALDAFRVHLNATQDYNVRLNGEYISYSEENTNGHINNHEIITNEESETDAFVWQLLGHDPYAMTIYNKGASKYIGASQTNNTYLSFVGAGDASKFIVKSGSAENTYEVMLATGDGVDASSTYYNIGRKSDNEVKIYSNDTEHEGVSSGSNAIRFRLSLMGSSAKYYNLIDKGGKKLVTIRVRDDILSFPGGYWSPLVSQYHYWKTSDFNKTNGEDGIADTADDIYTLKDGATELASMSDVADATFTETSSNSDNYDASDHQKTAVDVDDMRAQAKALSIVTNYEFRVGTGPYTYYTIGITAVPDRQIYVTYDVSNKVNLSKGALYLLKYHDGVNFRQEDGGDNLLPSVANMSDNTYRYKAVYPYCNGDCNFFVYGEEQYELQQQGAASTRTRWGWYLESDNNDPYHVKISSLQQETFNGNNYNAYFRTYLETFKDGSKHVVTNLAWPGITGDQSTEYMILGTVGRYQLVTTETIPIDLNGDGVYTGDGESNEHHVVNAFEQYWKTYDTVKNKLLKDILLDTDKGANPTGATTVPNDPASYRALLMGTGEGQYGFHSYSHWAYAKRFNGYNASGETKKGWEAIEHWYQTVNMGEGYFDFVPTVIAPVLILLDQHGWEIMRKPLPSSDKDPRKYEKEAVLSMYDSPMVKEYAFWATAKKRTGFHQYYQLDKRIGPTVDGKPYTSTSLGTLPPYGSTNVLDAKGNLNDQYVTYIVKDEYANSYTYNSTSRQWEPSGFLVQQGEKFVSTADGTSKTLNDVPPSGGMSQYIISNAITNNQLWILKPNANIDEEMGYGTGGDAPDWGSNPNAYEESDYKHETVAQYINDKILGKFSFSNGFDPYNIQISSVAYPEKYVVTNATGATLEEGEGAILGVYDSDATVSLGTPRVDDGTSGTWTWYDSRRLHVTNATFMAVSDEDGNMQFMPRFSQELRMKDFESLILPGDEDVSHTHTQLFRPLKYTYHIIDNNGHESLQYQSGGDLVPQTPVHFKSPFAKDFKYYKTLTSTGTNTYNLSTLANEIKESESFASKGMTSATNDVYVRYTFNNEADERNVMKGKWFTMQLNAYNVQYNTVSSTGGIYADATGSPTKPANIDATDAAKKWQWKFLKTPQSEPDPYAIQLFNRSQKHKPMSATGYNNQAVSAQDEGAGGYGYQRFALLPYIKSDGTIEGYALAVAGTGVSDNYYFLQGRGTDESLFSPTKAAAVGNNSNFTSTSCGFTDFTAQVKLFEDVFHNLIYKVYTNDGKFAISDEQTYGDAHDNDFVPQLPDAIRTPLLDDEGIDYRYYNMDDLKVVDGVITAQVADTLGKQLTFLYGLYDNVIGVRYAPYHPDNSPYRVPNVKGTQDSHVARGDGSHDAPLGLDGNRLYNIIWYNDNMMYKDGSSVKGKASQDLNATETNVWLLEGEDPYAIKIRSNDGSNNYINSSGAISSSPQTFMLLPKEGYDYGVLAVTGTPGDKLSMAADDSNSGTDEALGISTTESPTGFAIFALATHQVIYHLIIATTNTTVNIPYRAEVSGTLDTKVVTGSTQRDLTSVNDGEGVHVAGEKYQLGETINGRTYSKNVGAISLGDQLQVPEELYRPNIYYTFFVDNIQKPAEGDTWEDDDDLNYKYKGLQVTNMKDDADLLNKKVYINIVYHFNQELEETNNGLDFVRSIDDNKWYTVETKDYRGTPWLTQYTNAWGLEVKEGRGTHYTNDYLWSPLGDPYGFILHHRYTRVNSGEDNTGEPDRILTSGSLTNGAELQMDDGTRFPGEGLYTTNSIYELLEGYTPGYFLFHPVANTGTPKVYLKTADKVDDQIKVKLSSEGATEFTFGLSEELVKPYYDRAGYVGGLNAAGKTAYEAATNLMDKQAVVYNPYYIVKYTPGYYRLHSPEDIEDVTVRYASGYTHKTELDPNGDGNTNDALPMHFCEVEGTSSAFNLLKSKDGARVNEGFTSSNATRGDIPIPAVEYDPASIFYFPGTYNNTTIQTQGLYVKGEVAPNTAEGVGERAKAYMTATSGEASALWVMDIGGAVMLIHDRTTPANRKYLSYDQTDANHIYDLKLTHNTHTDHVKWLMQPANHLGLRVKVNSGGDEETYGTAFYYATFYAPFDVLMPDTVYTDNTKTEISKRYRAFICESATNAGRSTGDDLLPREIGLYNIASNFPEGHPTDYMTNSRFIPAGTPVLLATIDDVGYVKLTLPYSSPHPMNSSFISLRDETNNKTGAPIDKTTSRTNYLNGQYLEQMLSIESTDRIFTFGLPYSGELTLDPSDGSITASLPLQDNTDFGFYLNANPNKEAGSSRSEWASNRNNRYVYSNKVYYHATGVSSARELDDVQFVPVIFDEEGSEEEGDISDSLQPKVKGDNRVYDLSGRCVANEQQVMDGSWWSQASRGVYILNGRKIIKK